MKVARHFLNWDGPFLRKAAEFLVAGSLSGRVLDMHRLLLAVPGARAGRRLTELLVEIADSHDYALIPPKIITVGNLYRYFDQRYDSVISDLERVFFWREVLLGFDRESLQKLYSIIPDDKDFSSWYSLAQQIDDLYVELGAEGLKFSDALEACCGFSDFVDEDRWRVLVDICNAYEKALVSCGVFDLLQCHQMVLAGSGIEIDFQLVMVGCVDIRAVVKDLISRLNQEVVALIFAPETHAQYFDGLGCFIPEQWLDAKFEIPDEAISVVTNPHEQANAALRFLSSDDQKNVTTEDVVIGLCDDALIPYLRENFEAHGLQIRGSAGKRALTTSPLTLLALVLKYVSSRLYSDFAALVRHPDFELWYLRQSDGQNGDSQTDLNCSLTVLDEFQAEHLQARMSGERIGNNRHYAPLARLLDLTEKLFGAFVSGAKPFDYWGQVISTFLVDVYGTRALNRLDIKDREIIDGCEIVYDTLIKLGQVFGKRGVELEGREVLRLLLSQIAHQNVSLPQSPEALEMLGWLELSLDDAGILAVVGMNEGRVPEVINADCFLPNKLRKAMRLVDNDTRYARDLYILMTLINSKRRIAFIAGQRDAMGEGLLLSRLLLARDNQKLCQQILKIISPQDRIISANQGSTVTEIIKYLPKPDMTGKIIESVHVTAFRDYIACPYRFYLKHVLRLRAIDDQGIELNARQFGIIIHEALRLFADSKFKNSTDKNEITAFLHGMVDNYYRSHFGSLAYPVTLAQVFHIKERLRSFASWQAGWRKDGWEIKYAEVAFDYAPIAKSGQPSDIKIKARIDRVDYNASLKQWLIIDYKTGDKLNKPAGQHQFHGEWVDLQLPIYRRLFMSKVPESDVRVGFVCLPASQELTDCYGADWSEDDFQSADKVMFDVLGKISSHEFWPPNLDTIAFDEFDRIVGMIRPDFNGESDEEGN